MSVEPGALALVIDDDAEVATVTQIMLSRAGFRTHIVNSAMAALEWVHGTRPDVILLDLMMPDVDGFTLLRQLRGSAATRAVPVIVLSARGDYDGRLESEAAGANGFLLKPVRSKELVAEIGRVLRTRPADP
jgi:DNA-binding response OmpR family regulator